MEQFGLFLVGDSAYSIRGHLLTPYDNARPNSPEDSFNFFQSSQRIYVECAFGEIDRRWGILWKRLEGKLESHQYTIDSCLRLHNFIVNFRERNGLGSEDDDREERAMLEMATDDFMDLNPLETVGAFSDDCLEAQQRGRPSHEEVEEREIGKKIRNKFRDALWRAGLARPM